MFKKGDTLIEVTIAVGIFSLVAVGIVAVMSSGTSGAQTALETTLTREEIDAQAEALRFIQASYVAARARGDLDNRYVKLWQEIVGNAQEVKEGDPLSEEILSFSPGTCKELYEKKEGGDYALIADQKAFVIDTRGIGKGLDETEEKQIEEFIGNSYVSAYDEEKANHLSDKFRQAVTYPHLNFKDEEIGITGTNLVSLYSVEGIYVVAVKEEEVGSDEAKTKTAYYDFYIRSCWYGTGDQNPSTIATVIRLSDPGKIVTTAE